MEKSLAKLSTKAEGELGLVSTVLGCRENRDRIEFAEDLKTYSYSEKQTSDGKEEVKEGEKIGAKGLASDYKLKLSKELVEFV